MTNKSVKVGFEIVDETQPFRKLAKAVDELEHAGSEVDGLKDSILNLAEAHSKIEQQQGLVDSFKRLKKESIEAAQAIEKQEREIKQLAAAMGNSPTKKMVADFEKAKKTAKQLKARQEQLGVALQKTRTGLKQNGISTKKLAQAQQRLTVKSKLLANGTNRIAAKMAEARQEIDKTAAASKNMGDGLDKSTGSLGGVALKAGVAGAAIAGLVLVAKEIVTTFTDIDAKFDRMERTFTEIAGSTETGLVEMNRMIDVASRLGLSFSEISEGYTGFLASAKGANITFAESSELFEKTAQKVLAMGKNTEDVNGVLLAFSQILSKGVVSTEELNQIAERLPGTFQFAADAIGMTTGEMRDLIAQGKVASNDFLPKFIAQLKTTSTAQETNAQTSARLKNEWELLIKSLDKSIGVSDGVQESMSGLAKALKLIRHESDGDIDIIPDGLISKIVDSVPIVNLLAAGIRKVGEEAGKFIDEQNRIAEANKAAKQSTDELVQSYVRLNEARNGGDAAAVAAAEKALADAVQKSSQAYAKSDLDTYTQKQQALKDKITELTPKYDELSKKMQLLSDAGYQNSKMYADTEEKAEKLKDKLDALKATQADLETFEIGITPEDIENKEKAIEDLLATIVDLRQSLDDAKSAQSAINTETKEGREAYENQQAVIDALNTSLANQKAELSKIAPLIDKVSQSEAASVQTLQEKVEKYNQLNKEIADYNKIIKEKGGLEGESARSFGELLIKQAQFADEIAKSGAVIDDSITKNREAFEALGLSFIELSTGITDAEQKVINGVGNIVTHIKSVGGESKHAGEMLERYFVSASSKIKTPEGLEAFHKKFTELAKAAGFSAEKIKEMTDTVSPAFAKLGVDVDAVMNGISDSAETSMSNFSAAMEAAQQSGTNSMKLTQAAIDAVLKTLNSPEEFKAFDEQLKNLGIRSKATAEQLTAINDGRTKSTNEATEAVKKQNTAAKESVDVSKEQAAATKEATAATEADTSASKANTQGQLAWTENAKNRIRTLEQLGLTTEQTAQAVEAYQQRMDGGSVASLEQYLQKVTGVADEITRQGEAFAETRNRAIEMTDVLSDNAASTEDLAIAQDALFRATEASIDGLVEMDQTTLDNLRNAIDETKNRLKEMGETARQEAEDLQAQLAKLRGDDNLSRKLEEKRKLAALEEKLAAARKRNNQEEIEAYQKAIDYQKQIFAEKEKQYNEEKRQQAEREKSRNERKERREEPTRSGSGSGGAQFDAGKLSKEFKQSFDSSINQIDLSNLMRDLGTGAGKQLIQQMRDEASRMAR